MKSLIHKPLSLITKTRIRGLDAFNAEVEPRARLPRLAGRAAVAANRLKASRPLFRVLVINDNGLWINDFI